MDKFKINCLCYSSERAPEANLCRCCWLWPKPGCLLVAKHWHTSMILLVTPLLPGDLPGLCLSGCTRDVSKSVRTSVGMDAGIVTILQTSFYQNILFFFCCPCSMYLWLPGTATAVGGSQLPNKPRGWAFLAFLKDSCRLSDLHMQLLWGSRWLGCTRRMMFYSTEGKKGQDQRIKASPKARRISVPQLYHVWCSSDTMKAAKQC